MLIRWVIAIASLISMIGVGGCAFFGFPADLPEPYDQGKLLKIRAGESSQEWVASILGQPDAQLDNGNIWLYGETRMVTLDGLNHDYQSLLVVFENDVVEHYEVLESKYGCWSTGLCLVSGWVDIPVNKAPVRLNREKTALVSDREDDFQAKNFSPIKERCGFYLYKKEIGLFGKQYPPPVSMGSIKDEPLHYKGYIFEAVHLGAHTFTVEDQSMDFECEGGGLLYFEVDQDVGWNDSEFTVRHVTQEEGKAAIAERNLLVTW